MKTSFLIIMITLFGCSSAKRTPYQPLEKKTGGFSDGVLEESIQISRFEANSLTKRSYAEMFARYHSLEDCRKEGMPYSHILAVIDKSSKKEVTRSTGDTWGPSYYYGMGMSPFYSRYSGFGFSTGINVIHSQAWEETLIYPQIEVIYRCQDKIFGPQLEMRDVSPEEMKHLVKDLKGGIQVERVLPGSVNQHLRSGDIIIRANGERMMKGHQLLALFEDKNPVNVLVLREGEKKTIGLKGQDITEKVRENLAFLKNKACDFRDVKKRSFLCQEEFR